MTPHSYNSNSNESTDNLPQPDTTSLHFSSSDDYNSEASSSGEGKHPTRPRITRSATSPHLAPSGRIPSGLTVLTVPQSYSHPSRLPHGVFEEHFDVSADTWPPTPSPPSHEPTSNPASRRNSAASDTKVLRKRDKLRSLSSRLVAKIKKLSGKRAGAGQSGFAFDSVCDPVDPYELDGRSEGPRDTLRRMDRIGNPTDFAVEDEEYLFLEN